ncbi:MAG: putative sensor domain DACNV-containing protein [Pyrinomonadaceae bacterium]
METICEAVYAASLKREEGRHHDFSVVLTPTLSKFDNEIREAPYHGCLNNVTAFEKPIPIADLPKVAPAFDRTNQSLRIWFDEKGQLEIWGFANEFLDYYGLRIQPLLVGELLIDIKAFDFPWLRLLVTFAEADIVERQTPLHSLLPQGDTATQAGSDEWHRASHRKRKVFGLVVDIVNKMSLHEHGGTMLFVPPERVTEIIEQSIKVPIALRPQGAYTVIKNKLDLEEREFINSMNSTIKNDSLAWSFEKEADLLGQFTAVDGATVITTEFAVIAIGAKIKESVDEGFADRTIWVRQAFQDANAMEKNITDTGGTRHQSAAHFVYDNREAFAIVASQDGKISIIYWDEKQQRLSSFTHAEYSYRGLKYS